MLIWENSKLAIKALFNNKMRSLLTMLGIIIGIGSVIAIMTVSSSLTTSITDTFADMGANNVTVGLQKQSEEEETRKNGLKFGASQRSVTMDEEDRITDAMLQEVKKEYAEEVNAISLEETVGSGTVQQAEESANIRLTGINKNYFNANVLTLLAGRYLTEKDVSGNKRVIMVSNKVVLRVGLPPCAAAGFGAEFSLFPFWGFCQRLPALAADLRRLLAGDAGQIVPSTEALDRIFRNAEAGRYGAIAKPLAAQITDILFLCVCHVPPPSKKIRRPRRAAHPLSPGFSRPARHRSRPRSGRLIS